MTLWSRWVERGKIKGSNFYIGIGKKIHKNHYTKKVNFMWRPWGRFENIFIEQVWIESFLFHNTQKSTLGSHAQFIYTLYFQIVNIKKTNTVKKWYKVPVKFFCFKFCWPRAQLTYFDERAQPFSNFNNHSETKLSI